MKILLKVLLVGLVAVMISGCGEESSDEGASSPVVIDSGSYGGAWNSYSGPFTEKGNLYYYTLNCNTGYAGSFTVYDNGSVLVQTTKGDESCSVVKLYYKLSIKDTTDINATKYSSYSQATWYDTSTKVYYDTARYSYDGKMVGIVNNAFEALIQDSDDTGTQTIRLYNSYIDSDDYNSSIHPKIIY